MISIPIFLFVFIIILLYSIICLKQSVLISIIVSIYSIKYCVLSNNTRPCRNSVNKSQATQLRDYGNMSYELQEP